MLDYTRSFLSKASTISESNCIGMAFGDNQSKRGKGIFSVCGDREMPSEVL